MLEGVYLLDVDGESHLLGVDLLDEEDAREGDEDGGDDLPGGERDWRGSRHLVAGAALAVGVGGQS